MTLSFLDQRSSVKETPEATHPILAGTTQEILLHVQPGDGKPSEAPSPVRCRKLEPSLQDWDSVEYAEMRFDFTAKKPILRLKTR